ncbi:MAG: hypothetical protein M0P07_07295 [Candidatus Methanomethylophilaceae archaeon]|jgi:hypothetical protein|nr:hypothetical protein [Candidatus Methanomethylophilaceae archaeon]
MYDLGYSRDRHPEFGQVNFGSAELREPINILIDLSMDRGNASDSVQFIGIVISDHQMHSSISGFRMNRFCSLTTSLQVL